MNFSFCITTDYSDVSRLQDVISYIRNLQIPNYEILIIGGANVNEKHHDIRFIQFDESIKPSWITRKKNVLCKEANYENIVLLHDYYVFHPDWYKEFLLFGDEWDVCSNSQLLITGKRHFSDWVIWDHPEIPKYWSLDYNDWSKTKYMYISGNYFLCKKEFILKNPFNEDLTWGMAEDVDWSLKIRNNAVIKCNGKSIVKHNKIHRDARQAGYF